VGVLLLAVHLIVGTLLPLLHAGAGLDQTPDHAEASGAHHDRHGDACVVCRMGPTRFAHARPALVELSCAISELQLGVAVETLPCRPLRAHAPPRGPPLESDHAV
jgi:hypothetical protein